MGSLVLISLGGALAQVSGEGLLGRFFFFFNWGLLAGLCFLTCFCGCFSLLDFVFLIMKSLEWNLHLLAGGVSSLFYCWRRWVRSWFFHIQCVERQRAPVEVTILRGSPPSI